MIIKELKISNLVPLKPFAEKDPQIQIMCDRVEQFGLLKPLLVNNLSENIILDGNKLYVALLKLYGPTKTVPVLSLDVAEKDIWTIHTILNSRLTSFSRDVDNYIDPYLDTLRCRLNSSLSVAAYLDIDGPQKEAEELKEILETVITDELDIS